MASAGQAVNHLDEGYDGEAPDIWDNAYVIVDFASGARAMLELCMFAEGARYQEEIRRSAPRARSKPRARAGAVLAGPSGRAPVPQVIVSPRDPKGPQMVEIPVDPALLAAGDHNGSTFYQHALFNRVVRGEGQVEVTLRDGAQAVAMGLAAQKAAVSGGVVTLDPS